MENDNETEINSLQILFDKCKKIIQYKHHLTFLRTCQELSIVPNGLAVKKTACIQPISDTFSRDWKKCLNQVERKLITCLVDECSIIVHSFKEEFVVSYSHLFNISKLAYPDLLVIIQDTHRLEEDYKRKRERKLVAI